MKTLSPAELQRAVELLDVIVRPGDHPFGDAIAEAKALLGYHDPNPELGKGSAVRVLIPNNMDRSGRIVGESRDGRCWYVSFGTTRRHPVSKQFCLALI